MPLSLLFSTKLKPNLHHLKKRSYAKFAKVTLTTQLRIVGAIVTHERLVLHKHFDTALLNFFIDVPSG